MILSGTGMLRKHGRMRIILCRSFRYGSERGYGKVNQIYVHTAARVATDKLLRIQKQSYYRVVRKNL